MFSTNILETYLRELRDIRSTGAAVPETSYYAPLANLFNEIGQTLQPSVCCVMTLKNRGAGHPDGGLFTPEQFQQVEEAEPLEGQNPSRGAIEIKSVGDDAWLTAETEQVTKYWNRYRQVLVTNYRDFVLVGQDRDGRPVQLESYRLAANEADFWAAAAHPHETAAVQGERFVEYVKRVLLHAAPLATPQDVAWFLASYARDARVRMDSADLPALDALRDAIEKSLGIQFEGAKGKHFFRSTLVQTLFYGIFSAWVLWSKKHPPADTAARFNWHEAAWTLHVPMIKALFEQIAMPSKLGPLGLVEVLDWTGAALNRVDRAAFFEKFEEGHAVQYFYEPFLEAFDQELRKELGVWYTPPEIVRYMVARVDAVLREEMEIEDGLADPRVYVLDPCCGTGAFLVETLKRIAETLKEKGAEGLLAEDLKRAAMERVFGFEILTAPFVVAHLQLGLLLQNFGAAISEDKKERLGVFLTNSLTGWQLKDQPPLPIPEMDDERKGSGVIKRDKPILVVLGNPPYNAFAGVSSQEEEGLVEIYKGVYREGRKNKKGLPLMGADGKPATQRRYRLSDPPRAGGWGIKKFNLDDLYVRFFRLAERRITEMTGQGMVCFISNYSYLSEPSFVIMRQRLLSEFDSLTFDCLNGDSRKTGKLTPDGRPDPSVFSTEFNREGIRVGTAIGLLVRRGKRSKKPTVRFRQLWGVAKRAELLESLRARKFHGPYELVKPDASGRFSFGPACIAPHYLEWPKLVELCEIPPFNGPVERRGNSLIVPKNDKARLELSLRAYLDPNQTDAQVKALSPRYMKSSGEFRAEKVRLHLKGNVRFDAGRIVLYPFKPFDVRWAYLDGQIQPLFSRPSPELLSHAAVAGTAFFITRDTADKSPEGPPFYFSRLVCDYDCISGHARHFPVLLGAGISRKQGDFFAGAREEGKPTANLSATCRAYLKSLRVKNLDSDPETAGLIWMHALAIGYSPAYLSENADCLRQDWPRVPLPDSKKRLIDSAELGRVVAALLDTETPIKGVTSGALRPEMKVIGPIARQGGGSVNAAEGHLDVTAGWGRRNKDVTMPGKGKWVERSYDPLEMAAIAEGAELLGLSSEQALTQLGETTCDVYLNDVAYWRNVPIEVWEYTIGGYQVIKKWLSYREKGQLERGLSSDEAREVMNMARRIAALLLLQPKLDANYQAVQAATYPWPGAI